MKSNKPQTNAILALIGLAAFTADSFAVVTVDFGAMTPPGSNVITSYDPTAEDGLSWLRVDGTSRIVGQSFITPTGTDFLMSAITMKFNSGIGESFPAPSGFTIDFYQLSSPSDNPASGVFLSTQVGTMQPTTANATTGSYFTFELDTAVALEAGVSYGYVLAFTEVEEYNFFRLAVSASEPDPNGTRAWINTNGGGWGSSGETYVYYIEGTAVPEPGTATLLGLGVGAVLFFRRRTGRGI
jgi:hypothetical protein